jgi:pSer/pThr/pTyr-binding forkhead associated (FHA) protein
MYKYNCRKCPIRNRCIDESENSPSVKTMLQHAFEARTDTLKAWDRLQRNCLLLKAEEERAKQAAEGSLLSRRLRQVRDTKELKEKAAASKKIIRPDLRPGSSQAKSSPAAESPKLKPLSSSAQPKLKPLSSSTRPKLKPLSSSTQSQSEPSSSITLPEVQFTPGEEPPDVIGDGVAPPQEKIPQRIQKSEPVRPHWLTVGNSGRHIVLPASGELVLGRFDPSIGIPPDVDLSYEDRGVNTVSRRHAKIVGVDGRHTIEDLGSRYGVLLNGKRMETGLRQLLQSGDRIKLGQTQLLYDAIPTHFLITSPNDRVRHVITVTPTGRRVIIAPPDDVIIGHSDPYVNFVPDIDLSQEGDVAARVSRRHAIITWRNWMPHLEDLGSGFGTRLNGKTLLLGQAIQLKPGDHIWLGGCVLAYDVEL